MGAVTGSAIVDYISNRLTWVICIAEIAVYHWDRGEEDSVMAETYRSAPERDEPDDYWAGLSYLLEKHKPVTLAAAFHLVSVVEVYMGSHTGDLNKSLRK